MPTQSSTGLGDIFGQAYEVQRPKIADVIDLMVSGAARVARVRKGDPGFDDLCNTYEGHMEFFIVNHMDTVFIIGAGFTYAEVVDVR